MTYIRLEQGRLWSMYEGEILQKMSTEKMNQQK